MSNTSNPRDQVQHKVENMSTETVSVSPGNSEGHQPESEPRAIEKLYVGMDERARRRREMYEEAQAQVMALPTSDLKGRLEGLMMARFVWTEMESRLFMEYVTGAIAAAQGGPIPPKADGSPDYDPVSSMPMDTLRYIGNQFGVEGNKFRDFIQALTPEKAARYQEWEKLIGDMPETVVEVWKVIGWRIKNGVGLNCTRRSLMGDIGKVLDNFVFGGSETERRIE